MRGFGVLLELCLFAEHRFLHDWRGRWRQSCQLLKMFLSTHVAGLCALEKRPENLRATNRMASLKLVTEMPAKCFWIHPDCAGDGVLRLSDSDQLLDGKSLDNRGFERRIHGLNFP